VIATGGGVLVDESNCAALKRIGVIVCLTGRPEVIAARVERAGAYARADVQIDSSDLTVEQLADQVIAAFGARAARRVLPPA